MSEETRRGGDAGRYPGIAERVHLLGAGGAGLSGAARFLLVRGHGVSGVDRGASEHVELLRSLGIPVRIESEGLGGLPAGAGLVVRSAAVGLDHPHAVEAARRGIEVIKYSELLGRITPRGRTLAVSGTHGKTSTAWMLHGVLAAIAEVADAAEPSALIGGVSAALGTNAVVGDRDGLFAVEACEYDRSFLRLAPLGAVITNVEPDHLDYFGSLSAIEEAFARFADRVEPDGLLVVGAQVPEKVEHAGRARAWRLGRELQVDLLGESRGRFRFRLRGPGWASPPVALPVPGAFNVENAALAMGLAVGAAAPILGLDPGDAAAAAARALADFSGVHRRFEIWGSGGGVTLVHDFAHHPTEVRKTLEAALRALPARPLHVLFQPHQHSRTARFLADFVESLRAAGRVVVSEVYGARAHTDAVTAGAPELVDGLRAAGVDAVDGGPLARSAALLLEGLPRRGPCAVLVLGAGDVNGIQHELLSGMALRSPAAR